MHNYEESWGPLQSHHLPPAHISPRARRALDELESKPKSQLSGWLAEIIEGSRSSGNDSCSDTWLPRRYGVIEQSARSWVSYFFANLNSMALEFNHSSVSEGLSIISEEPKTTFELPCRRDPSSEPYRFSCFQGHLATYGWALLVRSYYEAIQIFIVPSNLLLGLETNLLSTREVKPLVELRAAVSDERVQWCFA